MKKLLIFVLVVVVSCDVSTNSNQSPRTQVTLIFDMNKIGEDLIAPLLGDFYEEPPSANELNTWTKKQPELEKTRIAKLLCSDIQNKFNLPEKVFYSINDTQLQLIIPKK